MPSKRNKRRRKKACAICGRKVSDGAQLTTHHVFHGNKYKPISDRYNFVITLCYDCHKTLHSTRDLDKKVQKLVQWEFERNFSREDFEDLFGRGFVTEEDRKQWEQDSRLRRSIRVMMKDISEDYQEYI